MKSKANNSSTKSIQKCSRSQDFEMLKTLNAREKLKFTELNIKVMYSSLETELRIRKKIAENAQQTEG